VLWGNHTMSAPIALTSNVTIAVGQANNVLTISGHITGPGGITLGATSTALSAGTAVLSGSNNYAGGTTVTGGKLVIAASGALPNGNVTISGGTIQLAANTGLAQMTSLAISGSGVLDITNNHVIISYTGSSPIATIQGEIAAGYNGGAWNGTGIISSMAPANSNYGIGYADSVDPGNPAGLAPGQIEVKYTLLGDANLDGKVNGTDFAILATNFNQAVTGWDQGDFNYDGAANGNDFAFIASNFNQGASQSALDAFAAANGLLAEVPEPGMMAILLVAGLEAIGKRRTRAPA
jgi:autotransporter-associated beta strand protein